MVERLRVGSPPEKPLLIYDGDCGFCREWIGRWQRMTGDRVDYAPSSAVLARFPEIPPGAFEASVQLVEPDGLVYAGAEAVWRATTSKRGWLLRAYRGVPLFARAAEWSYRQVASHRGFFSRVTGLL